MLTEFLATSEVVFEADPHLASLRDLCATEVEFRNTFLKRMN